MPTTINAFSIDCDAQTCAAALGAASTQVQDCPANINQSEVDSVILVHPTLGTLVTNWGASLVALDFDIDNTDATDAAQKRFFGVGSVPANDVQEVTLNNFQSFGLDKTFTLTMDIFDITPATYDYFRKIQCGKVKPLLYYTTVADKIYGSSVGISPIKFNVTTPLDSGEGSLEKITIEVSWKAKTSPDRYPMPTL